MRNIIWNTLSTIPCLHLHYWTWSRRRRRSTTKQPFLSTVSIPCPLAHGGSFPQCLCSSKTGMSSPSRKACTTHTVCFHSPKKSLFWCLTWIMLVVGFSSHCVKSLVLSNKQDCQFSGRREGTEWSDTNISSQNKFLHSQRKWTLTEITTAKAWMYIFI